jgi:hypothetical protein
MTIDSIASDIYYLRGVDDVGVDNGPDSGTFYVDVTLSTSNTNIEREVTEIVEDYGAEVQGVDDAGFIITFLIDAR